MTKRPKITNPDLFAIKHNPKQDNLKTSTEYLLSQGTLGASATKTMNFRGALPSDDISLEYTKEMLEKNFKQVKEGDLSILEEMLISQSFALNMAFNSLAARASRQEDASTMQMLLNLSLKAQNQSRATMDTLINLKQPSPTTFVKQANIAQGHQQVNNGVFPEKNITPQNEQLGVNLERMDIGTTTTPKRSHKEVETLGKVHGSKNSRRKS
jgi:hypothetical protein